MEKTARAKVMRHPVMAMYSTLMSRAALAAKLGYDFGGDRDLYEALGYKTTLTYQDYVAQYTRQDIAKAIIDRPVNATWRGGFKIVESDDDQDTALEKAWADLCDRLSLRTKFARLDRLTGLGNYGIMLLGLSDAASSADLAKPVTGVKHRLLYGKPYGGMPNAGSAQIAEYEKDPANERYGQPVIYNITVSNVTDGTSRVIRVHHSRVIHVADGCLESEVEGTPRLEVVYNRLKDLERIVGGSAEMFWRGARPGYQGKLDKDYTLTEETKDGLQDQIDEFEHNLRRMLLNEGIIWEAMATQVADPVAHVDVQIQMISAVTGIPKRVLTGSERGELASTQDRDNWFDLIDTRREEFAETAIIRPFVDRLIEYQILPPAQDNYSVQWTDLRTPSDEDRAKVGQIRADAIAKYAAQPMAESIVPPASFMRICLGLDDEDIALIEEEKAAALAEEDLDMPPDGGDIPPEE